jgi:osmotically inducible lipoprotein OsmB
LTIDDYLRGKEPHPGSDVLALWKTEWRRSMTRSLILAAAVTLALAGCGTSKTERGVSGGLLGAAGGAGVGAATGTSTLGGAALGGAAGAATGVLTAPKKKH